MINMCVAVVLNNFSWIYATEKAQDVSFTSTVSAAELRNARRIWSSYDLRGTGYIVNSDIGDYLYQLGPPLGLAGERNKVTVTRTEVQVQTFPLSQKGMCGFRELMTVRLIECLGANVTHSTHVLKNKSESLLKFQTAIRLVIAEIRIKNVKARRESLQN